MIQKHSCLSMDRYTPFWWTLVVLGMINIAGCGDSPVGAAGEAPMMLSFTTTKGALPKTGATQSVVLTDIQGNSLEITAAAIVVKKLEMEHADFEGQEDEAEDQFEELEQGPFVVNLPVNATTTPQILLEASIPEGLWKELEFEIHALSDDDPDDAKIVANSSFADSCSIRVLGQWTPSGGAAQSFTYLSRLDAELELELVPPLQVSADSTHNITVAVEIDGWFRNSTGILLNPATAVKDQPNEEVVKNNIIASIEAFEDDDHDGHDDDSEDE